LIALYTEREANQKCVPFPKRVSNIFRCVMMQKIREIEYCCFMVCVWGRVSTIQS